MDIMRITPDGRRFDEWAGVFRTVGAEQWGRDSTAYPTDELRAMWGSSAVRHNGFAAVEDGSVVGAADVVLPLHDNRHLAFAIINVLAEHRRQGIGTLLLEAAETLMREEGRTTVLIEVQTPSGAEGEGEAFLRAYGFRAAQRCVRSAQSIPVSPDVARAMRSALETEDDYDIEVAVDELPEAWLQERARLAAMMSTDTPLGDLAMTPEHWDAARITDMIAIDRERGRRVIEAVAWHRPTGTMAAFTHVSVPRETPWIAYQDDTLVEARHRGNSLGYRVKAAVSLALPDVAPEVEVQRTWNDETNTHMLRINAELGYQREGTLVEWQKILP